VTSQVAKISSINIIFLVNIMSWEDSATCHIMGLYWVDAGVQGNEIADNLTKDCPVQKFTQPEPSLRFLGRT